MLINILKFIHLLFALTLFGMVLFNFAYSLRSTSQTAIIKSEYLSLFAIIAMFITGGLLVFPKGYTFATPWINVAFSFLTLVALQIGLAIYIKYKKYNSLRKLLNINYATMIVILVCIIHDAVCKHTLWQ